MKILCKIIKIIFCIAKWALFGFFALAILGAILQIGEKPFETVEYTALAICVTYVLLVLFFAIKGIIRRGNAEVTPSSKPQDDSAYLKTKFVLNGEEIVDINDNSW